MLCGSLITFDKLAIYEEGLGRGVRENDDRKNLWHPVCNLVRQKSHRSDHAVFHVVDERYLGILYSMWSTN
jgi:hypothetical protein